MTQVVTCRYHEYRLPEKPSWLDRLLMPVAETLGTEGYRRDRSFTLNLEHPELLLVAGSKFVAGGPLAQRDEPVEFEVVRWSFRFEPEPEIDLVVREVKPTPFEAWFSRQPAGRQYAITMLAVLAPALLAGFGILAVASYPEPLGFWAWFGRHVRALVGWSLFLLVLIAGVWAQARAKSSFTRSVLLFLWSLSLWLLPLVWLEASRPSRPLSGRPEEAIQYLDHLRSRLTTFTLLLAGVVPWLTLVLKWLGWDRVASALDLAAKRKTARR